MNKIEDTEEHLAALPALINHLSDDESDLGEDLYIEITSNVDETETELINLTDYLQLSSKNDDDDNDHAVSRPTTYIAPLRVSQDAKI